MIALLISACILQYNVFLDISVGGGGGGGVAGYIIQYNIGS